LRVAFKAGCHNSGFWLLDSAVCKTAPPARRLFLLPEREAVSKVLGCGDPGNGFAEYWRLKGL